MQYFSLIILVIVPLLCASNPQDPERFIVGGNDARPEQFPYLVSMRRTDEERRHICGGALVNVRWILTAAHCIVANRIESPRDFVNVVGTVSRTSDEGDWYETEEYVLHPEWNEAIIRYDVALIKTIETIQFSSMVSPVRLTANRFGGNITAIMAGFGQTREQPRTDVKQFLESTSMTAADCRRAYQFMPFNAVRIFDGTICMSNPAGRGVCGGDSGGSIVVDMISVGIASWVGIDCALGNPDVYSRTSNSYYWIRNVTDMERVEE